MNIWMVIAFMWTWVQLMAIMIKLDEMEKK